MRWYGGAAWILMGLLSMSAHAANCPAPASGTVVNVPGHPFAALPSPDDCWMYVSLDTSGEAGSLAVLKNNGKGFDIDQVIPLAAHGYGEALTHDGSLLVVTEGATVEILDTEQLQRHAPHPLRTTAQEGRGAGAVYATVRADDKQLFVSDEYAKRVSVFDLDKLRAGQDGSAALIGRIPTGQAPVGLAVSPDGRWLYATSQVGPRQPHGKLCAPEEPQGQPHPEGLLLRIDLARADSEPAQAITGVLPVGCNPVRVALSPSGQDIWVSVRGDGALWRLQASEWSGDNTHLHIQRYAVGPSPIGVAVRGDDAQVWTAVSDRFGKPNQGLLAGVAYRPGQPDAEVRVMKTGHVAYPRELVFLHDQRTLAATLFEASAVAFVLSPD